MGILAALTLGALNARGTEESGMFQLLVTSAKVGVLFVFIAGAIVFAGPADAAGTFVADFQAEPVNVVSVAALAFITFFGFSAIAASAGEIIEPRRTVPRAIAASIVTVTVLYALVIAAMVNAPVPREVLAEGETAMGTVAASFLVWGGAPHVEELVEEVVPPHVPTGARGGATAAAGTETGVADDADRGTRPVREGRSAVPVRR